GRAHDPGGVAVQDDGAVHLGQLAQTGGGELHVHAEAAARDPLHHLVVTQHDQAPGAAAQDAFKALSQVRARGYLRQRGTHARSSVHELSLVLRALSPDNRRCGALTQKGASTACNWVRRGGSAEGARRIAPSRSLRRWIGCTDSPSVARTTSAWRPASAGMITRLKPSRAASATRLASPGTTRRS